MAKKRARVGSGIPGFGDSKGSQNRIWEGGEFLLQIEEVTEKAKENQDGEEIGKNVRFSTVCLGGPTQPDDTPSKGKKINLFININYDLPFTIDQLADAFLAAGVKFAGSDEPPYSKMAGKKIVAKLGKRVDNNGVPRQSCYFIAPSKSKAFGSKTAAPEEDED